MRLQEWIQDKALVKAARDFFDKNKVFQQMVGVLESENPLTLPLGQQGPSADDRSYRLGLIEGYHTALKNLKAMWAQQPPKRSELRSTFEEPEA
jgi:hypothetical protein